MGALRNHEKMLTEIGTIATHVRDSYMYMEWGKIILICPQYWKKGDDIWERKE